MKVMLLNPPSRHSKNVVRDLVYGCWCKGRRIASAKFPPLGFLHVASVLENSGHDVILLDSQAEDKDLEEVKKIISEKSPEIIVSSTSTMSFLEDCEVLREIKKIADVKTLLYGSHVTFLPQISLEQKGVDFIVMGEPEYVIRDFINSMEKGGKYKKTLGIGYKEKGKTIINPRYPFIENLDELPFPNRKYIRKFAYFNPLLKRTKWTTAATSRGCPGRCNFCTSPSFYGQKLRMRSPENVVKELEEIISMGYEEVFFRDETFTANPERVRKICALIKEKNLKFDWICNARVGTLDKETVDIMKSAGCHLIKFGVESGVQRILDNINKGIRVEKTRETFSMLNSIGMESHAHIMLGCIGENSETIDKTIKFVKEINPTTATFGAFTPYPGTKVFDMVKEKEPAIGDGSSCDLSKIHTIGFYNQTFCDLTEEEIGKSIVRAYKEFYLRPSYVMRRLMSVRSSTQMRRLLFAGLDVLSFVHDKDSGD